MGRPARTAVVAPICTLLACMAQPGPTAPIPEAPPPPAPVCEESEVPPSAVRLLTRFEYDNTIRDLFAIPESDPMQPSAGFPPENRSLGFDNNAEAHVVSPLLVDSFVAGAERMASYVVGTRMRQILPCDPQLRGELQCADEFLDRFLPRAFRRPPTNEERGMITTFFRQRHAESGFAVALNLTLQVILQSPQFLYRLEPGNPATPGAKLVALDDYQLATRLSYFLYGSMPDDDLMIAAKLGRLSSPAEIEAQARRMLNDPKARRVIRHFHRQWLQTEKLATLVKERSVFPEYDDGLRASWMGAMDAFVEDAVLGGDGTIESLFLTPQTFVDAKLASVYGLPRPAGNGLQKVALPAGERAGLLTQPALMALLSNADQTSPIMRGVFVRERILCQPLQPPPANIPIEPPDPDPNLTTRERFRAHTENEFCRNCHVRIDPVGFGFERYDGLGRYRLTENNKTVDASGELRFTADTAIEGPFDGAVELSQKLVSSSEVRQCIMKEWFRFAMGRDVTIFDTCTTENLDRVLVDTNGSIREMMVALTLTDAFRFRAVVEEGP